MNGKEGLAEGSVAKAIGRMIVDHARGLHERIADGAADKGESSSLEVFAHRVGFSRLGGNVRGCCPMIRDGFLPNEPPDVFVE